MSRWAARLPRPNATSAVPILVVGGVIAFTLWQLHPSLLFSNTTTSGGDTGAHVGMAWYLEHDLLPHFRLTGWSPWWYDGYPQFTFYFPLPYLLVAILNLVAPYNVAFKLVTVSGSLLLPIGAYVLGRGAGMRRPGPSCLAAATLPFLFDRSFTIYGGNLASTLAGEFGYSLSLSIALIFLGLVADGLETGRRRWLAAALLAICALCHFIPAFWAGIGAVVLTLARFDRHRLRWLVPVGVAGVAVTGFWVLPFYTGLPYTTNMGWVKVTTYLQSLFPHGDLWVVALAAVGALLSLVRRRRLGTFLVIMAAISGAMFVFDPTSELYNARLLPFWILCLYLLAGVAVAEVGILVGELWAHRQGRWARAYDLGEAALVALDTVGDDAAVRLSAHPELSRAVRASLPALARDRADLEQDTTDVGIGERETARVAVTVAPELAQAYELKESLGEAAAAAARDPANAGAALDRWAAAAGSSGLPAFARLGRWVRRWRPELVAHAQSGYDLRTFTRARPTAAMATPLLAGFAAVAFTVVPLGLSWMPISVPQSFVPAWIRWNYTGYQGKTTWPEYHALITTMSRVSRRYGCGRAMWEYGPELNDLGTPMALMLLPYWTDNCVDSMEGLLFESSATTPYHFINQAELSLTPSEAVAGLPYGTLDVAAGVQHLQLMGVKYYMAFTPQAEAQARQDPALRLVARTGPWPTVVTSGNRTYTVDRTWRVYLVKDAATVTPVANQPVVVTGVQKTAAGWLRVSMPWYVHPSRWRVMLAEAGPSSWARVSARALSSGADPGLRREPPTTVSHVATGTTTVGFDVSRVGTPVLVKTSYFPAWHATGARGPWRVAPNLMVVVPTSHHVSLTYGRTASDWAGIVVTLLGIAGVIWLGFRGRIPMPPRPRRVATLLGRRGRFDEDEDLDRELAEASRR